jgi:hypothetical protein
MTDPSHPDVQGRSGASARLDSIRLRNQGWYARAVAACAVVAMVLGVVVAPGLHGNATDAAVDACDRIAAVFGYATAILVSMAAVGVTIELTTTRKADTAGGALVVGGAMLVVVLLVVACVRVRLMPDTPLDPPLAIGLVVVSSAVTSTAAAAAVRAPHTRAIAIVLALLAMAALVRAGAWELAKVAGERASTSLYAVSRGVATSAVVAESFAQLTAVAWIGTRGTAGVTLASLAAVGAFAVTWGAAVGVHADAPRWASALHTALASAAGLPSPFGMSGAQSFLTASAILLAASALLLRGQPSALVAPLALALISRGSYDAPIRAVAAVTAAAWTMAASFDERLLWAALGATRRRPQSPVTSTP